MTQSSSKLIINVLIGAMVVVALVLTYFYFTKSDSSSDVTVVETGAPVITTTVNVSPKVQQIIGLFNEINAIELKKEILSQGAYSELVNYRTATTSEETSTPNPFQKIKF